MSESSSPELSTPFEPLAPARRADGVFEQLRSRILSGALPAGSRLPNERELAEALAVNRGSVREALKRLEFLELIEVRHGQGSFVKELSGSSALQLIEDLVQDRRTVTTALLRQLLEFRRNLQVQMVELAAVRRTEDQLQRATELLEREAQSGRDPSVALALDLAMNALLGEAAGNLPYQLIANLFSKLVARLGPLYYNESRDHERSLATHRELLAALAERDAVAARRIVQTMLDYSERAILEQAERLEAEGLIGPGARKSAS
ncbi:MAG: GntR family transcriptional regulator [Proteobacteria bacterium]|nr:GntR family transcriptional regulator [Pseudomonadota bacterium]